MPGRILNKVSGMSESVVKLLNSPYGVVAYANFRQQSRAFADKSGIIRDLDGNDMTPYPVLLRPRRFGKSTFVQMLKCFYDLSYAGRYEELFAETAIYGDHLASHNSYHVLDFDFSGISGNDLQTLVNGFIVAIRTGIADFRARYPDFSFAPRDVEETTPANFIKSFFNAYKEYPARQSLYLMIDEYDNFANSILCQDLELFRTITSTGGFLKDFYAAVKEGTKTSVAKTFITGVSSVSLDSLTSGFNISLNVTACKCFNAYAGFTEKELQKLIPELVDVQSIGTTADELISRMKPFFDGYCFSSETTETVFNSSMCLYYLSKVRNKGSVLPPEKHMDPASDHDGSKLQSLFALADDELADDIISTYLSGDRFYVPDLAENINLSKSPRYNEVQLLSMLYYLGYLTLDPELSDNDGLMLKIPNLFMSRLFAQCTVDLRLKPSSIFREQKLDVSALLAGSDDLAGFAASCTEFLSSIFTNQVLSHMSEMALNLVLHAKLNAARGVIAELQKSLRVPGEGEEFADLVLTVNKGKSSECVYLFELKYAPKTKATKSKIASLQREATDQIRSYRNALEFRAKTVRPFAMIFAGSECVYCGNDGI